MRIIANKKDYYDCIQRNGFDPDIVYVRKPEVVPANGSLHSFSRYANYQNLGKDHKWNIRRSGVIGFAGKLYPYVMLVTSSYWESVQWQDSIEREPFPVKKNGEALFVYNQDEFYEITGLKKIRHWLTGEVYDVWSKHDSKLLLKHFDEVTPIFEVGHHIGDYKTNHNRLCGCLRNPILRNHQFMKVIDPYQAYQQLRVYMANQAQKRKAIPDINDEDRAALHGFNAESFRMPKQSKPNRKNREKS